MPGIVGIVGPEASAARLEAALDALLHFDPYRAKRADAAPHVELGQVWRDGEESKRDWCRDEATGVVVLLNGHVLEARAPHGRLDARAVLRRYLEHDRLPLGDLDGAFVIAVADPRRRTLVVANDRLGTLPVYYAATATCFALAPEAKALFPACGLEPSLSVLGVAGFLNTGYCLAEQTLFAGIRRLEPGTQVSIAFDTRELVRARYWKMLYSPDRALARRSAAERELHDCVRAAHEALIADASGRYEILLSGGWDSRGILAFLDELGAPARRAVAWGKTKDVPGSDPYIAERLAERLELPFQFVAYDSDALVDQAAHWCFLSELANDNTGWFAEGAPTLARHYRTDARFTLVGDEVWGWHGHPRDERDARNAVLPATLGPAVAQCLLPGVRDELRASYEASVDAVLAACENDHPIDRRDFLYLHGRVARFIFALGYYKELAVEVRRPFLLAGVLDVVARLPRRFRVEKNLYLSMLARYFPELAAFPPRRSNSLPEWTRDIRTKPRLRELFLDLLDERNLAGVLGELLDPAEISRLKKSFFDELPPARPAATPRSAGRGLPLRLKQRIRAAGLYRGAHDMRGAYPPRGAADLLRCVAFVSLLERVLQRFKARASRPAASVAAGSRGRGEA